MLDTERAIRRHLRQALLALILLGGSAFAWSTTASLDSAVVTQGTIVVETNIKKVQHPSGGVVGAILVREGQKVQDGQIVVRLDETATKAALGIVVNELTALRARAARLAAERIAATHITFPPDVMTRAKTEDAVKDVVEGEMRVFATRLTVRRGLKAQLIERMGQMDEDLKGLAGQQRSLETQLRLARDELVGLKILEAKNLVPKPRITAIEREIARNEGLLIETVGRSLATKGKIAETELQVLQLDNDHMTEISKELREVETRVVELEQRRVAAEDQLKRVDIRAPISGVIHQLAVHTIGGVISQTEPLMLIVPDSDRLILEVKIQPQDIDQVHLGQSARLRFTAFNQRTTPEISGTLFRIGGDLTRDGQTGQGYYVAAISITSQELKRLGSLKLLPGMPADAFITTGSRTFASYLMKPISDQMSRSMRER